MVKAFAFFLPAALVAGMAVTGASATTVTLDKQVTDIFGGGGKRSVSGISNRSGTFLAGGLRLNDGSQDFIAWCLDVQHNLSLPGVYNITDTPFSATTGSLGATRVANIENLFEVVYPSLDLSNSTGANGGNNQSAGFQMALWELVYETSGSFDVDSGAWSIGSPSAAKTLANGFLAQLGNPIQQSYRLTFYETTGNGQNLVSVAPVPLPAAASLFVAGLAGFAGLRRRSKAARPA